MSKRPRSPGDSSSGRTTTKRPAAQQVKQKHIYLVVDDWERGYSIYKINEDDFDSGDSSLDDARAAEPPFVRMEAKHPYSWSFVAHGSKILAMQPHKSSPGLPSFDTETLAVSSFPPPLSRGDIGGKPVYVSAGDRLLAFYYPFVEVLAPEPEPEPSTTTTPAARDDEKKEASWSWTVVEKPQFVSAKVSSYAVHTDGRTVFMSVKNWRPGGRATVSDSLSKTWNSTFTFDMETLEFAHAGEWIMPFKGRAHYDTDLDAWVGLCLYPEGAGRVCSCDVPPRSSGCGSAPAWKLGRDVFFDRKDSPSEVHLGATLVYDGDGRFCVLERRMPTEEDPSKRIRVVKMTSFALKYDKDGDLRRTRHCTYASVSYEVAHKRIDRHENPVAFWM